MSLACVLKAMGTSSLESRARAMPSAPALPPSVSSIVANSQPPFLFVAHPREPVVQESARGILRRLGRVNPQQQQ